MQLLLRPALFWVTCYLFHKKLADYVYQKGKQIQLLGKPPLYDIIQDFFPNLQSLRMIPEITHIIPIASLIYYVYQYGQYKCLQDFLFSHGTLLLFRAVFFTVTLLPDSSQMCHLTNHFGSCFDLMFSGHVMIMFLCTLLLHQYFIMDPYILWLLYTNVIFTSFLIIVCRNHYTIDVLIAFVMTYFVWLHTTKFDLFYSPAFLHHK